MANSRQPSEGVRGEIRGAGLRATPARTAVLGLLREVGGPLSHAEVAEKLAGGTWDRATIYRNLIDLAEVGLVRRTDVGDHVWRFEAVGEGEIEHPHFVCKDCGTIECLPDLEMSVRQRSKAPRAVRRHEVEVQLRGLCDDCG